MGVSPVPLRDLATRPALALGAPAAPGPSICSPPRAYMWEECSGRCQAMGLQQARGQGPVLRRRADPRVGVDGEPAQELVVHAIHDLPWDCRDLVVLGDAHQLALTSKGLDVVGVRHGRVVHLPGLRTRRRRQGTKGRPRRQGYAAGAGHNHAHNPRVHKSGRRAGRGEGRLGPWRRDGARPLRARVTLGAARLALGRPRKPLTTSYGRLPRPNPP